MAGFGEGAASPFTGVKDYLLDAVLVVRRIYRRRRPARRRSVRPRRRHSSPVPKLRPGRRARGDALAPILAAAGSILIGPTGAHTSFRRCLTWAWRGVSGSSGGGSAVPPVASTTASSPPERPGLRCGHGLRRGAARIGVLLRRVGRTGLIDDGGRAAFDADCGRSGARR